MARSKKPVDRRWAQVLDAVLDHFAPAALLYAAEVEAATQRFKKALLERALGAELQHHVTQEAGAAAQDVPANHRNGTSAKTVLTDESTVPLAIPRDRHGTFEPQLIPKHARRFTGFDDRIIALYARGLTVREIQAFLPEMYAVGVSPDLISTVTDAAMAEVTAWQVRPLEAMYPVVFLRCPARQDARRDGGPHESGLPGPRRAAGRESRHLGVWIEQTEGAKFWMRVFADLQTRGCRDILIAVTDGPKGMSEALAAVFPATTLQTCLVHLLRHSLDFATWKTRKPLAGSGRSTWRRVPRPRSRPSTRLPPVRGARAFRRSPQPGAAALQAGAGRFQATMTFRSTSQMSLSAPSSLGKWPRVFNVLRS
jgi:putative transposase